MTKFSQKGSAALLSTVIVMVVGLWLVGSVTSVVYDQQKIIANVEKSSQAYYAAEAGVEDALLKLTKSLNFSSYYDFNIGESTSTISISPEIGGARTIAVEGDRLNRIKNVEVVFAVDADSVSFHYGVQVGDYGIQMESNAVVHGNIFANGSISGAENATIYGDAISAGEDGLIDNILVDSSEGGGNAWAKNIVDSDIDGDAHYTTISGSTVGGTHYTPEDPLGDEDMPISQAQILLWKSEAATGGTASGYFLGGTDTDSIGPIKIDGDMSLASNAILTITGTVWVTGDVLMDSNTKITLDSGYGSNSGVIIVDGKTIITSNVVLCGAEGFYKKKCADSVGSYLMILSTNTSTEPASPAIGATSNTNTAILYAADGLVVLSSNAALKEVIGYGIYLSSNADVTYETGLANTLFSSGPGGGWNVSSWKEVP